MTAGGEHKHKHILNFYLSTKILTSALKTLSPKTNQPQKNICQVRKKISIRFHTIQKLRNFTNVQGKLRVL